MGEMLCGRIERTIEIQRALVTYRDGTVRVTTGEEDPEGLQYLLGSVAHWGVLVHDYPEAEYLAEQLSRLPIDRICVEVLGTDSYGNASSRDRSVPVRGTQVRSIGDKLHMCFSTGGS